MTTAPMSEGGLSWRLNDPCDEDPDWVIATATSYDGSLLSVHGHSSNRADGEWTMICTTKHGVRMNYGIVDTHIGNAMRKLVGLARDSASFAWTTDSNEG